MTPTTADESCRRLFPPFRRRLSSGGDVCGEGGESLISALRAAETAYASDVVVVAAGSGIGAVAPTLPASTLVFLFLLDFCRERKFAPPRDCCSLATVAADYRMTATSRFFVAAFATTMRGFPRTATR